MLQVQELGEGGGSMMQSSRQSQGSTPGLVNITEYILGMYVDRKVGNIFVSLDSRDFINYFHRVSVDPATERYVVL